jgi:putative ATP-dependent endonuclease of the OLD family
MKLLRVEWTNFRRLPDAGLDVRDHLVLVGPNDSGKSSLLRAIHLCIGASGSQLASLIQERDFTDPSLPLSLSVTLGELVTDERAAFPDEIDIGPPEVLRITVGASIDPSDSETRDIRRSFPDSGHGRSPSRIQLEAIGWAFVPATRSLIRELGAGGGSAVQSLLSSVDLSEDAGSLMQAIDNFRGALDESESLVDLRTNLAESLASMLSRNVQLDDLRVRSDGDVTGDPLSGLTITIRDGGVDTPLTEQSDGVRAMSVLAILGMSHSVAKIVGIDEPEIHLHSSAQKAIGRSLMEGSGQKCLATHSAALVSQVNPLDIAVFGADRRVRQLPEGTPLVGAEEISRHWSSRLLDPLTARQIILVEGPADRIVLQGLARGMGKSLDREGTVIFELDGSTFFGKAYGMFGPDGFNLPVSGLLDEDSRPLWADAVGVAPAALESKGFVICAPDLEGLYVTTLGVQRLMELLEAGEFAESQILSTCAESDRSAVTEEQLSDFCRHKRRKVKSALAIARGLLPTEVDQFASIVDLLRRSGA